MKYCRLNLSMTDYKLLPNARLLTSNEINIDELNTIYTTYCQYKKFESVVPIFDKEYFTNDIIAYYDSNKIVAFNMVGVYDSDNVEDYQFAWTYHSPKLYLGLKSIEHECAYYKSRGFKYLYLGTCDTYKKQFQGYEQLGPL